MLDFELQLKQFRCLVLSATLLLQPPRDQLRMWSVILQFKPLFNPMAHTIVLKYSLDMELLGPLDKYKDPRSHIHEFLFRPFQL